MLNRRNVLLISCPDETGLVHKISGVLFRAGLNVTENGEFVDPNDQTFFMRTEFSGSADPKALLSELRSLLPTGAQIELRKAKVQRLVILATREAHCLGDLLLRHSSGDLNAEIVAVISQYTDLEKLAGRFEIPFHHVPATSADGNALSREEHEAALLPIVQIFKPDYLVLAKYMRVLTQDFVSRYSGRILNIHHSFLPAFAGKKPYHQAYERGVKIIGATAHFVNEQLDDGPIITQSVIPINHSQAVDDLIKAGRDIERVVLARALNLVLEDRVIVQGRRTLVFE